MWWHEGGSAGCSRGAHTPCAPSQRRLFRAIAALAIAALAGGCFQPLYGEQSPTGGPVLRVQPSAVDVIQVQAPKGTDEARIAAENRKALLYDFTGGGYAAPPTNRPRNATARSAAPSSVTAH